MRPHHLIPRLILTIIAAMLFAHEVRWLNGNFKFLWGLKKRIHEIIREQARFNGGLLATFGASLIIAVCTVICTGQVYLPTIGFVMGIPELRKNAIFNLIL